MDKIQVSALSKSFGSHRVLNKIDLSVKTGESVVIIGGSGSGKSVFLKCILGLLQPDGGNVVIDGQQTEGFTQQQRYRLMRRFGVVFQSGALFDSLSILENVGFTLLEKGQKRQQVREQVREKLLQVGLSPDVMDKMPAELSGGMRKRVALARAICNEPEILFYDEPTTGLDPIMSDIISELIIKLNEELGITSITITHNMKSAFKIADRMAMLYKGKLIAVGTPDAFHKSTDPYVSQFVNGSAEGPITQEMFEHLKGAQT